jgi:hypothetical protein
VNPFFAIAAARAGQPRSIEQAAHVVRELFPFSQAFGLRVQRYWGLVCNRALERTRNVGRREQLEQYSAVPARIAYEEFGEGKDPSVIHYNLLARLGPKVGLDRSVLLTHPYGALPETRKLVETVRACLGDLYQGAGCIRAVEATALPFVEALNEIFPRMRAGKGPLYTPDECRYVSEHLQLEREHDAITSGDQPADSFARLLCTTSKDWSRVDVGLRNTCEALGDFWSALVLPVFPETRAPRR